MPKTPMRRLTSATPANPNPTAAFAYLRHLPGMDNETFRQTIKELIACTEQQNFALAGTFYEERSKDHLEVWRALIVACRNEQVSTVIVPSSEHFHSKPDLAAFMRDELATAIRGTVFLITEASVDDDQRGGNS